MSIQDKIAALPSYPDPRDYDFRAGEYFDACAAADRARLALAREWIEKAGHIYGSGGTCFSVIGRDCTCGRNAALAALEPPCS